MVIDTKITIVIPAYNEEKRIYNTLLEINDYIKQRGIDAEIIVVNDGSTDNTAATVNALTALIPNLILINNSMNQGKGSAVRKGMLAAKGDLVLFTDADLSTPIAELDKFVAMINTGFDIVIGSRKMAASQIITPQPLFRRIMGYLFQKIVAILVVKGFRDTQCGFKLFSREACCRIFQQQLLNGFAFDVEVLYLVRQHGFKLMEMPVAWNDSRSSTVVPVAASYSMFKDLIYIKVFYSIYYVRVYERYQAALTKL